MSMNFRAFSFLIWLVAMSTSGQVLSQDTGFPDTPPVSTTAVAVPAVPGQLEPIAPSQPRAINLDELIKQVPVPLLESQKKSAEERLRTEALKKEMEFYKASADLLKAKSDYEAAMGQVDSPTVLSVFVFQNTRNAIMYQKDIGTFSVREGSELIGGYIVETISDDGKVFLKGTSNVFQTPTQFGQPGASMKKTNSAVVNINGGSAFSQMNIPMPLPISTTNSTGAGLPPPAQSAP